MVAKEYCCYTRPYSSIEGFQIAHTLYYSASVEEEGVVLAVRRQQGEECHGAGHLPGGRLRAADVPDAVSVRKWSGAGQLAGCTGRRRAGVLALHGCKWAAGERKACAICGICWF